MEEIHRKSVFATRKAEYAAIAERPLRCTVVDVVSDGPVEHGTYLGLMPDDQGEMVAVVHIDGDTLLRPVHRSRVTIMEEYIGEGDDG